MSELDAIFKQLPEIDCAGKCWRMCSDIVGIGRAEATRLGLEFGKLKSVPGHVGKLAFIPGRGDGYCAFLTEDRRCSVYKDRPSICRVACVAQDFTCEHGCKPKRVLEAKKAHRLLERAVGAKS